MARNEVDNAVVEVRADIIGSLTNPDQQPILRLAHFLMPTFPVSETPLPKVPLDEFITIEKNPNNHPMVLILHGWQKPQEEWCEWVNQMDPIHQDTWRQAGILDAIRASKSQIHRDEDIIFGLARKWNHETKSFIFKWGEASVTLEDVCVLGGFSVIGDSIPVSVPQESDMSLIETRLTEARKKINKQPPKKATYTEWIKLFRDKRNGFGDIEHEAFLVFWLSKFVFPKVRDTVGKHVQPIAIQLARGTRIALAPAVLASVYAALGELKNAISKSNHNLIRSGRELFKSWSLMHLVQVWAWERFLALGPNPNLLQDGDPRMARWDNINGIEMEDIGEVLDGAVQEFRWRPYYTALSNWTGNELYRTHEEWLESFAMFIRHSELVGLDELIEQYLPHRVSRQFGFDQDVPGLVPKIVHTVESAWAHYRRPFDVEQLYTPNRLYESDVTVLYSSWWKNQVEDKMTISEMFRSYKKSKADGEGSGKNYTCQWCSMFSFP